jgi:hypothetical protein
MATRFPHTRGITIEAQHLLSMAKSVLESGEQTPSIMMAITALIHAIKDTEVALTALRAQEVETPRSAMSMYCFTCRDRTEVIDAACARCRRSAYALRPRGQEPHEAISTDSGSQCSTTGEA